MFLLATYANADEILNKFVVAKIRNSHVPHLQTISVLQATLKFALLGTKLQTATKFISPIKSKISHQCYLPYVRL